MKAAFPFAVIHPYASLMTLGPLGTIAIEETASPLGGFLKGMTSFEKSAAKI